MASSQPVCVINIGPKESRKRLTMGGGMLAVGIGVGVALILTEANPSWRIGLFLPFWMGALGLFQAKEKT